MEEKFIPLSVPNMRGRELDLVTEAIQTEWVSTAGPFVEQFERDMASYLNVPAAVSCQSGTAGLHVALRLAGVTPGDLVVVPALTFIAAVNPVRYLGADPVFMDCDDTLCVDTEKLERFCEEECSLSGDVLVHGQTGRRVKAVVVVHVFGEMADMVRILDIAKRYGLRVIEDATEALGTRYTDGPCANHFAGTIGDFGVYSFNGNKIITTGGGGMIVARDQEELAHAKHLTTQAKSDPVYFEHDEVGYNYRLTNLQAALGIAQLEQIEGFIKTKEANYREYESLSQGIDGIRLLSFRDGVRSNRWFYSLLCEGGEAARDAIISGLAKNGIQSRPVWGIICDQGPYRGSIEYEVEKARWYRERIVNVPCGTNLTEAGVRRVMETVGELMGS